MGGPEIINRAWCQGQDAVKNIHGKFSNTLIGKKLNLKLFLVIQVVLFVVGPLPTTR